MKNKPRPAGQSGFFGSFYRSRNFTAVYIIVFAAMTLGYLGLTLLPQPDKLVLHQYHLTAASFRWILYPAVLLIVISWVLSLIGSLRVKSYSDVIKNSADGQAFSLLALGFLALTLAQTYSGLESTIFARI